MNLFAAGMCLLMHGYYYQVAESKPGVYLLSQTVTVFEKDRTYSEYWKSSYVDKEGRQMHLRRGWQCR